MVRKLSGIGLSRINTILVVIILIFISAQITETALAQQSDNKDDKIHEIDKGKENKGGCKGCKHKAGFRKFDPEKRGKIAEFLKENHEIRIKAEGHKKLAELYLSQNKTDEAILELKKIIEITSKLDFEKMPGFRRQLGLIYLEIAELLIKNNKVEEAKNFLNEGIEKVKTHHPAIAARAYLKLGDIFKANNNMQEAEQAYKKAIEFSAMQPQHSDEAQEKK